MTDNIWVLGATGRSGRGTAERLHAMGHQIVLAGRDAARLKTLADKLGNTEIASGSLESLLVQLKQAKPKVVVNTVGPFARTTKQVIDACPPGTHYVDIANELSAFEDAAGRHIKAVAQGSTLVTGAGFGVTATESLVVKMAEQWPNPTVVRVDAVPSLATEAGLMGAALAGSILDGLPEGGRKVRDGKLVKARVAGQRQHLTTPDGDKVTSAAMPSGELYAAWRDSGAASVMSASIMIPSSPAVQAILPVVSLVARIGPLRRFGIMQLAKVKMKASEMPRKSSWGHCSMEWSDGTRREGWLRLPDAQEFTTAVTAEVAHRLATREVKAGACTPAALFGSSLATDLGGTYVL